MSTVEITRVEDIQPGDRVTLVWNGDNDTTVSGVVRTAVDDRASHLEVGDHFWRLSDRPLDWHVTAATREVPDLPTEPGSVIVNATIRGEAGHAAILDDYGDWRSLRPAGDGFLLHRSKDITAWEPGRIVPEGGAS